MAIGRTLWIAWAVVVITTAAGIASAHARHVAYCTVTETPAGLDISVFAEPRDEGATRTASASVDGGPNPSHAGVLESVSLELKHHVTATTAEGACLTDVRRVVHGERFGTRGVWGYLTLNCPPGQIYLRNAFRLADDSNAANVCRLDGRGVSFVAGHDVLPVGKRPGWLEIIAEFVETGVVHVLSGFDHLLFLLALLLASASQGSRGLGQRTGPPFELIKVISGFTIGHSVTLIAGGLQLIHGNMRVVESLIALSLVAVGVSNIVRQHPRHRFLVALGFGLVHGLGFASVHASLETSASVTLATLLSFNLGVEAGQLLIVIPLFPFLVWAARRPWYRPRVLIPLSAVVSLAGLAWFATRAFNLPALPGLGG